MCGITAYSGTDNATLLVADGLKQLEYRGYDSWGMAWMQAGKLRLLKKVGRIGEEKSLPSGSSHLAIAHTRWATHGGIEQRNAHPLLSNSAGLAVVHNGIIENYQSLKAELLAEGFSLGSTTDSEVIPNLIELYLKKASDLKRAFSSAIARLEGTYALVVLDAIGNTLAFARKGSPLCIGLGEGGLFLASDTSAFLGRAQEVIYLQDKEYGFIDAKGLTLMRLGSKKRISRKPVHLNLSTKAAGKLGHSHFMLKEILEQPSIIMECLNGRIKSGRIILDELKLSPGYLQNLKRIMLVGCGTAYHACLVSRPLIESLAGIPTEVDFAGEYKYRNNPIDPTTLHIFISQSGETAETIGAMRRAKSAGAKTLSLVNVAGSTLARESDSVLYTRAGQEISVASTKAFTAQLITMALFALHLSRIRNNGNIKESRRLVSELLSLGSKAEDSIKNNLASIKACARHLQSAKNAIFIARGINYPLALEGALKLKEVSYIHAEGMPASELKHGALALVDGQMPVICIAPDSAEYAKLCSNIQEILARKGRLIAIATTGNKELAKIADFIFYIPKISESLSPILAAIPLQLLAYYTALERGYDIDKPRNLAKSVTVE